MQSASVVSLSEVMLEWEHHRDLWLKWLKSFIAVKSFGASTIESEDILCFILRRLSYRIFSDLTVAVCLREKKNKEEIR